MDPVTPRHFHRAGSLAPAKYDLGSSSGDFALEENSLSDVIFEKKRYECGVLSLEGKRKRKKVEGEGDMGWEEGRAKKKGIRRKKWEGRE